ncbi:hypothetical protein GCK72_023925 [Caenorhabditis remanei]|uniref:Uncharacterized protein n=1 Tax=Caenorhabditis remanei TaxID=31234 RepID=E3NFN5_CAERE|nr:hypothetical protein GCK72_023925 [Caenorhabditis remanei]EFO96459.1 hypothetical protein CRE_21555 [Caenorhabditis remanei]KAF1747463.1 hypothetical protein GCK72_023925 [Caenorhabditis remanei]
MPRLMLFFCIALIANQGIALHQPVYDQDDDINVVQSAGGFHLVNEDRVISVEPVEARLSFERLRALPIMKKSIAIGRAGFRPGKRTVDIYDF